MIEEAKDERKGISCEKCSMCGGAFVHEIKVEEKPTDDGKAPPPGVIIFHEATHHIVGKWCPACSALGHPQEGGQMAKQEKPAEEATPPPEPAPWKPTPKPPYTGPFPKGTRVVVTKLDGDDAKKGLKVGMRGVTVDSDDAPYVKLDKSPDPEDDEICLMESQLTLEKDYDKGKRPKKGRGK